MDKRNNFKRENKLRKGSSIFAFKIAFLLLIALFFSPVMAAENGKTSVFGEMVSWLNAETDNRDHELKTKSSKLKANVAVILDAGQYNFLESTSGLRESALSNIFYLGSLTDTAFSSAGDLLNSGAVILNETADKVAENRIIIPAAPRPEVSLNENWFVSVVDSIKKFLVSFSGDFISPRQRVAIVPPQPIEFPSLAPAAESAKTFVTNLSDRASEIEFRNFAIKFSELLPDGTQIYTATTPTQQFIVKIDGKQVAEQILKSSKSTLAPFTQDFVLERARVPYVPPESPPLITPEQRQLVIEFLQKVKDYNYLSIFSKSDQEKFAVLDVSKLDDETLAKLANKIAERLPEIQQIIKETQTIREVQTKQTTIITNEAKLNELTALIEALKIKQEADRQALFNMASLGQRINNISNVTITNPTFSAGSITDADIPDTITASNYLPLGGGTITATLKLGADAPLYASSTLQVGGAVRLYGDLTVDGTINITLNNPVFEGNTTSKGDLYINGGDINLGTGVATSTIVSANGNLGIGTTSPYSGFSVWGSGTTTSQLFSLINSASSTLVQVLDSGSFGIGTTSPGALLAVQGNALFSGNLNVANIMATGTLSLTGTTGTSTITSNLDVLGNLQIGSICINCGSGGGFTGGTTTVNNLIVTNFSTSTFVGGLTVQTNKFVVDNQTGNVGIGTTTPSKLFSVHGDSLFSGNIFLANLTATGTLTIAGNTTLSNASTTGMLTIGNGFISQASSTISNSLQVAGLLQASSSLSVGGGTALGSTLSVTGTSTIAGLSAGFGTFSSNLITSKDLSVSGLANLTGFISSASSTVSGDLHVGGVLNASSTLLVANLSTLSGGFISQASSTINSNLLVSGFFNASNTANINTLNLVNQLTVANGGTGSTTLTGLLKGNGTSAIQTAVGGIDYEFPLTFSNMLTRSGNVISGSTTPTFSGITSTSTLNVTGDTYLSNASTTGMLTIGNGFISQASSTIAGTLQISGNLQASSSLSVGGGTALGSTLSVTGTSTLAGLSAGFGTFSSNLVTSKDLSVGGLANLTGFISSASSTIAGNLQVSGGLNASSTLTVADGARFYSTLQADSLSSLVGGFISSASSTISNSLQVSGVLNASSTLLVANLSTLTGGFISTASSTINSNLSVSGFFNASSTANINTLNLVNQLTVANGGTGSTTLTGLLKGNGTSAIQTAIGGIDYEFPLTFSNMLTRSGNVISGSTTPTFSGLTSTSTLNVSGNTTLANASTTGMLTIGNGFISQASSTVSGNLVVSGGFNASSTLTVASGARFYSTLQADLLSSFVGGFISSASSTISGNFHTSGVLDASSTLLVANLSTLSGGFISQASSTINSNLLVSGVFNASSSMAVTGGSYFGGNVGIGTTSPGALLAVQGTGLFTGTLTAPNIIATGTLTIAGNTSLANASTTGMLTIGNGFISQASSTISNSLQVAGLLQASSSLSVGGGTALGSTLSVTGTSTLAGLSAGFGTFSSNLVTSGSLNVTGTSTIAGLSAGFGTFSSNLVTSKDLSVSGLANLTGFISSASSTISNSLHISGNFQASSTVSLATTTITVNVASGTPGIPLTLLNTQSATNTANRLAFQISGATSTLTTSAITSQLIQNYDPGKGILAFSVLNSGLLSEAARFDSNGFFGIGTTTPGALLAVQGTGLFTGTLTAPNIIATGTLTTTGLFTFDHASGTQLTTTNSTYLATAGGRVGIGTADPSSPLHVVGAIRMTESGDTNNIGIIQAASDYLWLDSYGTAANSGGIYFRVNDAATTAMTILANGNVGIGTTSPGALLAVHGNALIAGTTTVNSLISTSTALLATQGGNVGIGTSSPMATLDVKGDAKFGIGANRSTLTTAGGLQLPQAASANPADAVAGTISFNNRVAFFGLNSGGTYIKSTDNDSTDGIKFLNYAGTELARIMDAGNVGIGTTSPGALLAVQGTGLFTGTLTAPNIIATGTLTIAGNASFANASTTGMLTIGNGFISNASSTVNSNLLVSGVLNASSSMAVTGRGYFGGKVGIGTTSPTYELSVEGSGADVARISLNSKGNNDAQMLFTQEVLAGSSWGIGLDASNNDAFSFAYNASGWPSLTTNGLLTIDTSGRLGIGTTSPGALLAVHGNALIAGTTTVKSLIATSTLAVGGSNFVVDASGRVGIGIANPSGELHVAQTTSGQSSDLYLDGYTTTGSSNSAQLHFLNNTIEVGGIKSVLSGGTQYRQGIAFYTKNTTDSLAERVRIDHDGNLGIGTTTPGARLAVQGDALISGNLNVANIIATGTLTTTGLFTFDHASGTQLTTTGSTYLATAGGNVGIGTTTPGALLAVQGDSLLAGTTTVRALVATSSSFSVGGTSLVVDASGRVGIGTANPALGVGSFFTTHVGTNYNLALRYNGQLDMLAMNDAGSAFVKMNIDASPLNLQSISGGNVGIGTTSPYSLLTLYKAGSTAANSPQLVFSASSTASGLVSAMTNWAVGIDLADEGKFKIASSSVVGTNDRFVIDGAGNVGIGTAAPSADLEVDSENLASDGTLTNMAMAFTFDGAAGGPSTDLTIGMDSTALRPFIQSRSANTTYRELLLNPYGGKVGIGTTSPTYELSVEGSGADVARISLNSKGNNDAQMLFTQEVLAGSSWGIGLDASNNDAFSFAYNASGWPSLTTNGLLTIDTSGRLGIGTTSPGQMLSVNGNALIAGTTTVRALVATSGIMIGGTGGNSLTVGSTGNITITNTTPTLSFVDTEGGHNDPSLYVDSSILYIREGLAGNVYHAFSSSDTGDSYVQRQGGNFGIGTTTPGALLAVHGNALIAGTTTVKSLVATSTLAVGGSNFVVDASGKVGIGTLTPTSARLTVQTAGYTAGTQADGQIQIFGSVPLAFTSEATLNPTLNRWGFKLREVSEGDLSIYSYTNSATRLLINNSGYVGIGTTSPDSLLHLWNASSNTYLSVGVQATGNAGIILDSANGDLSGSDYFTIIHDRTTNSLQQGYAGAATFNISSVGNVGVGTTTPGAKLAVNNTGAGLSMLVSDDTDPDSSPFVIDASGNVGIGTSNPIGKLQIIQANETDASTGLVIKRSTTDSELDIGYNTAANAFQIASTYGSTGAYLPLTFYTTSAERMRILANGNVGIGTTSPGQLLSVHGNALIAGTTTVNSLVATNTIMVLNNNDWTMTNATFNYGGNVAKFGVSGAAANFGAGIWQGSTQQAHFYGGGMSLGSYVTSNPPANGLIVSGNVGIGTTTPYGLLSIEQGTENASLWIGNTGSSSPSLVVKGANGNGYVGIGTNNPTSKLEIRSNSSDSAIAIVTNNNGVGYGLDIDPTGAYAGMIIRGTTQRNWIYGSLGIGVGATSPPSLGLLVGGNTGIGTTTPGALLAVHGNALIAGTTTVHALIATSSSLSVGGSNFVVDASGNVGIGTTTPGTLLSIGGDAVGINFTLATSTFSTTGGINLKSGCFAVGGVCVSGGGGGSVGSATLIGQVPYYATAGTTLTATSTIYIGTNSRVSVGTTTTDYDFAVAGKNSAFNSSADGSLGAWATNGNALPEARYALSSVVANGYLYAIAGYGAAARSDIYYTKLNSDGSTGSWTTNVSTLPEARYYHTSVSANGYIYVIGGFDSSSVGKDNIFYAKLNNDGSISSWKTNTTVLPAVRFYHTSVVANGYLYVIGGTADGVNAQTTVYYAKLNADGSVGTWSTSANGLPLGRFSLSSAVANGYVYAIGGSNGSNHQSTVYYAKLNSDGSTGAWSTNAIAMTTPRSSNQSTVINGYLYVIGGYDGTAVRPTSYYVKLNNNGSTGAWATSTNDLPDERFRNSLAVANGYVYVIAGHDSAEAAKSTVYYSSIARTKISGNLDLLGFASTTLGDVNSGWGNGSSVGGSIFAGNIFSAGQLEVTGNTQLWNGLNVNGTFSLHASSTPGNLVFSITSATSSSAISTIFSVSSTGSTTASSLTLNSPYSMGSSTPQANTLYKENIVKAWASFTGVGTIAVRDGFNVASLTDNGAGIYTVTWSTNFATENYAAICMVGDRNSDIGDTCAMSAANDGFGDPQTASTLRIDANNGAGASVDVPDVFVIAIGDQ